MTRAIGYVRGSGVAQDDLDELDAQDGAIVIAARDRDLELRRTYADASTPDDCPLPRRRGLLNAIGILEPGDTLVVASADRIGPDPRQLAMVERLVASKGCHVLVAAESDDRAEEQTAAARRMTEALAEYEQFVMAAKPPGAGVRRSRVAARRYGGSSASPGAVQAIIEAHAQAGWQADDIAAELNHRGLHTPAGARWEAADVHARGPRLGEQASRTLAPAERAAHEAPSPRLVPTPVSVNA